MIVDVINESAAEAIDVWVSTRGDMPALLRSDIEDRPDPAPVRRYEAPKPTTADERDDAAKWRNRAACTGLPVEVFYPSSGAVRLAASTCSACPVRAECLESARQEETRNGWDEGSVYGYRGGMSAGERIRWYASIKTGEAAS